MIRVLRKLSILLVFTTLILGGCSKSTGPTDPGGGGSATGRLTIADSLYVPGTSLGSPVSVSSLLAVAAFSDSVFVLNPTSGFPIMQRTRPFFRPVAANGTILYTQSASNIGAYAVAPNGTMTLQGSYPLVLSFSTHGLVGSIGTFLLVARNDSLIILSANDPTAIVVSDSLGGVLVPWDVAIGGNRMAMPNRVSTTIADITNPGHPTVSMTIPAADESVDVAMHGLTLFVAERRRGVRIFSLPNIATPIAEIAATHDSTNHVTSWGDTLVVGDGSLLLAYNVADPAHPQKIGELALPGVIMSVSEQLPLYVVAYRFSDGAGRMYRITITN